MRWVTYRNAARGVPSERVGLLEDGAVYGVQAGTQLTDLLGDDGSLLAEAADRARRTPTEVVELNTVELCAPVPRPPSLRDFSAFEDHARNSLEALGQKLGDAWYDTPIFYFGNPNAMFGPTAQIAGPGNTEQLDYELEVAAVVGRGGKNLDPSTAEDHIAGYCVFNDWSARDLQTKETATVPIGPAKGKDFANTSGPYLVTRDELEPYRKNRAFDLTMTASVNGREYSRGNVADLYWSFGELLAYASRGVELVPGDIIGAGTCGSGCILELSARFGSDEYPWLQEGDRIALEIEHLGRLENTVTFSPPPPPLR
jgi:2-keto-4-pentenoate hydratase/2-oxohepta-3-ene-1,7-dioic acid hydratase in catechol pathway